MLPSSLQRASDVISQIPQPAGWGSFTLAYNTDALGRLAQSPKRQAGIHASRHKAAPSICGSCVPPRCRLE